MSKEFFSLKLSEIADVVAGQSPESIYYSNIEGVPFLQGNRTFGTLYPSIDTYTSKVTKLAKKDEVLMSVRAPVGDLNFAPCDLCIGRGLASIKAKDGNNKFIYYALKYNINNLLRQGSGTTFDSVNKDVINDFELILPKDKADRDKVTNILSALDSKIELNNRINAELEAMAKTLYDYWFVQFDFPDEKGKPYKTSGGKMVWNEELKREIPEGWEVKKFGDVVAIKNGRDHKHLNNGSYPIYGSGGIMRHSDSFLYDSESILIPRKGSLGNLFYINEPFWCVDTIFYTQMKFPQSCKYLFYTTQNFNIAKMNTGTAVPSMTTEILNNLTLVFPPTNTLKSFDDFLIPIFKKKNKINIENQKLAELRDWLLPMLMNGQVKVN